MFSLRRPTNPRKRESRLSVHKEYYINIIKYYESKLPMPTELNISERPDSTDLYSHKGFCQIQ